MAEVTKESCPFRTKIPDYLLVTMETITTTSNLVSAWIPDTSSWWSSGVPETPVTKKSMVKKKPSHKILQESNYQGPSPSPPTRVGRESIIQDPSPGIDMMPIPSSKHPRPIGVQIGPPIIKKRISFAVHNKSTSLMYRIRNIFTDFF
jgi:hypothetical protein